MPEYAYRNRIMNMPPGPKYTKMLNMGKFWLWQVSQYANVTQPSEYVRICLDSEYDRVLTGF